MGQHNIEAAVITHKGSTKSSNEDNYYINGKYKADSSVTTDGIADKKLRNAYVYAVCDGMGGESYGELASLIAAATLEKFQKTNIRQMIDNYVSTANEYICDLVVKNKTKVSGSTLALLSIQDNTAITYNLGNSKIYFCRKGDLYLVSKDHYDEDSDTLTEYLGIPSDREPPNLYESDEIKLKKNDTFLLCTTGLTEVIKEKEIVEILSDENDTAINITKKLVAASQERKCREDVTAIVVRVT